MMRATALTIIGMTGLLVGASSLQGETVKEAMKDAKESVQQFVYDIADKDTVSIKFDANSSKLSESAVAEIRTTMAAVKSDGNVKEVVVVAYSDKPYPKDLDKGLPQADRDLAKRRAVAVEKGVIEAGGKNVQVHNMAERASWFSKKLVTVDAQVKNEAGKKPENQSRDDAFFQALGQRLESKGGPGKVFTVIRYENAGLAH